MIWSIITLESNTHFSEALDKAISEHDSAPSDSVAECVNSVQRMPDLLQTSKSAVGDLIDLNFFDKTKGKVYASVAEMKRSKVYI